MFRERKYQVNKNLKCFAFCSKGTVETIAGVTRQCFPAVLEQVQKIDQEVGLLVMLAGKALNCLEILTAQLLTLRVV